MRPGFVWWMGAEEYETLSTEQKDQLLKILSDYAAQNELALNGLKKDIEKILQK